MNQDLLLHDRAFASPAPGKRGNRKLEVLELDSFGNPTHQELASVRFEA
jgi:hypothetical protein